MEIRPARGAPVNGEMSEAVLVPAPLGNALRNLSLTPAQTRLAIALFKGQSVEAYARQAGISINTARWHVKHIYDKVGVHRQTELTHRLLRDMGVIAD